MATSSQLLKTEHRWSLPLLVIGLIVVLSGITTYILPNNLWEQWLYLIHGVTGVLLTVVLLPYGFAHFRRTLGLRRAWTTLVGSVSYIALLGVALSGVQIFFFGQSEGSRWVLTGHIYLSILASGLIALHIVEHFLSFPKRRRKNQSAFPGFQKKDIKTCGIVLLALGVSISLLHFLTLTLSPSPQPFSPQQGYDTYYGENPFAPSLTETPEQKLLPVNSLARATDCQSCHAEIFEQWQSSMHAKAASDATYVRNINLLEKKKGITATRYCEGCHAPVALLSGELTEGGLHGGTPNTPAFDHGVGCIGCHGISHVPSVKGVASFHMDPVDSYLFSHAENAFLKAIHRTLVRIHPKEHRSDMARPVLGDPRHCASCHAQFMDESMNDWGWVKMQDDYSAWLSSPYSGQSDQHYAANSSQRCQDCHMPLTSAPDDPSADARGMVRDHRFPGANTAVPFIDKDQDQLEYVSDFLRNNKIRIAIETPIRRNRTQSKQYLDESLRRVEETPYYLYLGELSSIKVLVSNIGVGHDFPGGTIDINEAWVSLAVRDASGKPVYQSGSIDQNKHVEQNAYFYRSIPVDRSGQHVWKHDLFNMVGESYRNVLAAGETDVIDYDFTVPNWAKGPLTVTAALRYRKLNRQYTEWVFQNSAVPDLPIVDMAITTESIPLRVRPTAFTKP